jgi:hypothetical protein
MSSFNVEHYTEQVLDLKHQLTEGDKVLIGCWMIADALLAVRGAIVGPPDISLVEGLMRSADILGDKVAAAASDLRVLID